ncbi:hypothetical protein, partial [Amycolatopsis sp. NPDC051716]|uniref:hypothetical protein n=1 Tax=Amycolatopsis sp. NPDC051716 TaxID=3155804 RepID=UPI003415D3DC
MLDHREPERTQGTDRPLDGHSEHAPLRAYPGSRQALRAAHRTPVQAPGGSPGQAHRTPVQAPGGSPGQAHRTPVQAPGGSPGQA